MEIEEIKKRIKKDKKPNKKINNAFSKILISTIFVFGSLIFINYSDDNLNLYKKCFYEENLSFNKINTWYKKHFGDIMPTKTTEVLASTTTDIYTDYENYYDGVKFKVDKGTAVNLIESGVVVFKGEKENYGNVVILQGIDGYDYWYGNITNSSINLYDYLEKNTIIGESASDALYLVLKKDNEFIKYEDYKNK